MKNSTFEAGRVARFLEKEIVKDKDPLKSGKHIPKFLFYTGYNILNKNGSSVMSLGIKLTNNDIKDIMKVIKSLEIGGILFKERLAKRL